MLEAHREIYGKVVTRFSAQELVNCVPNPRECGGQGGCRGATVELGMAYVQQAGIRSDDEIPYLGRDQSCKPFSMLQTNSFLGVNRGTGGGASIGLLNWRTLPENKEEPLARALVEKGPVAVSVAANTWSEYSSGVFDNCDKDAIINHAVTLYGYGKAGKDKYWTIKNSWGPTWGENGYIRLLRHDSEEAYCGTDNKPEDGTGCKGGPPTVPVCGSCGILYDSVVPNFAVGGPATDSQK